MGETVIQSYAWHEGKCFFVSTINRESSSMEGGTYAETMVWEFDFKSRERGGMIWQGEGSTGSARTHFAVCQRLIDDGLAEIPEEGD